MKAIPEGFTARHTLMVRDDMTVDFEQPQPELGKVHRVYATYWLSKHFELVGRKLILPFLESNEEGIGFEVYVKHIAPALPGMQVVLSATHLKTETRRVYAHCEAYSELGDKIAEGKTTQVIMPRHELTKTFDALKQRWETRHD